MDDEKTIDEAWAVTQAAARAAWRVALDEHARALTAFAAVCRTDRPGSPVWRDALARLRQARLDLRTCWELDHGRPRH